MIENEEKTSEHKRLYRSVVDKMIGGVCGGFAEYFGIDSTLVRVIWLIFTFFGGFGIIAYIACLIVMKENPYQDATQKKQPHNTGLIVGVVLILLGLAFFSSTMDWGYFHFRPFRWHLFRPWIVGWDKFWPIVIILVGVLYIYHILKKDKKAETASAKGTVLVEKKITRSKKEKMIGGVCGGLAEYLTIDPVLIRVLWILITIFSGIVFGVIVYIILLIVIPEEANVQQPDTKQEETATNKKN